MIERGRGGQPRPLEIVKSNAAKKLRLLAPLVKGGRAAAKWWRGDSSRAPPLISRFPVGERGHSLRCSFFLALTFGETSLRRSFFQC